MNGHLLRAGEQNRFHVHLVAKVTHKGQPTPPTSVPYWAGGGPSQVLGLHPHGG